MLMPLLFTPLLRLLLLLLLLSYSGVLLLQLLNMDLAVFLRLHPLVVRAWVCVCVFVRMCVPPLCEGRFTTTFPRTCASWWRTWC
jgi:hypothetical protein